MWLLDVDSRKLVHFMDDRRVEGKYAILSHTWEEEEVTFNDIHKLEAREMKGYLKIDYTCKQAKTDGLQYAWVDTCCINKDSSAELSEAINSMFRWYQKSAVCYVYLADMRLKPEYRHRGGKTADTAARTTYLLEALSGCRWFTRGWTLQELIAPSHLDIYDELWAVVGHINAEDESTTLAKILGKITHIDFQTLSGFHSLNATSLAQRMCWASRRHTTRIEDAAYSLLGLLGINMPLLYGEGGKAFIRLQEELLRSSTDRSILLWQPYLPEQMHLLIAPNCFCFRFQDAAWNGAREAAESDSFLTNRGLRTTLTARRLDNPYYMYIYLWTQSSFPVEHPDHGRLLVRNVMATAKDATSGEPRAVMAYEVVRAPARTSRASEFVEIEKSVTWTDMVLLHNAPSPSWTCVFDLDSCLRLRSIDGQLLKAAPAELLSTSSSYKRTFAVGLPSSDAERQGEIWFNGDATWSRNMSSERESDVLDTLKLKAWSHDDNDALDGCFIEPTTFILRVWRSTAGDTEDETELRSRPTTACLSRLWTIKAADVTPANGIENDQVTFNAEMAIGHAAPKPPPKDKS